MNKNQAINDINIFSGSKPGDGVNIHPGYGQQRMLEIESINISTDNYGPRVVGEGDEPEDALFITVTMKLTEVPPVVKEEEADGTADSPS